MKPSNVMIDHHGHVRLVDFGIARDFQAGQRGTMIGTEGYSPPEQYRGEASPQADIYALGATLHHLLSKGDPRLEAPFSFSERPLQAIHPGVTDDLEAIINTALAYNPEDRFPDALTLRAALRALKFGRELPIDEKKGTVIFAQVESIPDSEELPGEVVALWSFECEDEIRTKPVVVNGRVFVSSYDHHLWAINIEDGSLAWKFAAEAGFAASPHYEEEQIYIGSEDHRLYAVNADNGRLTWYYELGAPIRCTANYATGHVFVGTDEGIFHAINTQYTREAWRFEAGSPVRSRPMVDFSGNGRVFFGAEGGDFYCLDFGGAQKWRFRAKRAITAAPALYAGVLFVASVDWTIYALEADTGFAIWRTRNRRAIVSSPAVDSGGKRVYVGCADDHLYAFNARNGKLIWKFETGDQIASSPVVNKERVYVGSVDGNVYCVDTKTGDLIWKFATGGAVISSPTFHDDVIYIGSADHRLYALSA